jgi:toxin ParE1/3/4
MTAIRWTEPASDDLLGIIEWIGTRQPKAAASVGRRILATVEYLRDYPQRGRPGRSPDTRELVISGLPYLVVYNLGPDDPPTVNILRVLHGAMLWPPPSSA